MSERLDIPLILNKNGLLPSLSGAVILVGATGRLSHALIVGAAVFVVYVAAPLALKLAEPLVPDTYRTWVRVLVASTVAAIFSRIAGLVWPLLVRELALYLGMVPLCLISSGLIERSDKLRRLGALKLSVFEAAVLSGLALAFALIREPLGFGALSIPSADGITLLFYQVKAEALSLRSLSTTAGGFMILGYLLALYRKIRFRFIGAPLVGEDD